MFEAHLASCKLDVLPGFGPVLGPGPGPRPPRIVPRASGGLGPGSLKAQNPPEGQAPDTLGKSKGLREAASDDHNTFAQGSGALRALSEGPETFRKQRQTTGMNSKITKNMKIVESGLRWFEMS